MDFFQSQNQQKNHPSKHHNSNNKKRLTQDQVRLLETTFTTNKKLEPEQKLQLANQLRVPPRQVAIWYQNKRARWKTQSLELDYNTLQVKLENALADRRRLERQVVQLQEELRKAHHTCMLFANLNHQQLQGPVHQPADPIINNVSNCNSSSDEGAASSSLHEEVNGEVLQFDHDLYACLYGAPAAGAWDN